MTRYLTARRTGSGHEREVKEKNEGDTDLEREGLALRELNKEDGFGIVTSESGGLGEESATVE